MKLKIIENPNKIKETDERTIDFWLQEGAEGKIRVMSNPDGLEEFTIYPDRSWVKTISGNLNDNEK